MKRFSNRSRKIAIGLLRDENNHLVVRRLHFGDILEGRSLASCRLVGLHAINGKGHIFGGQRRAVVKFDPFLKFEHPSLALKLPGLGQDADIIFLACNRISIKGSMTCCQFP